MEVLQSHIPMSGPTPEESGDDASLVLRAQRGDGRAFALLYHRYLDRVYAFAAWRLASREAAEEATQQIFFRALRGLPGYRNDTAFAPWLFAIAHNVIADVHRSQRRATVPIESALDVTDPAPQPDEQAMDKLQRSELQAARDHCLSERERELFDLLLTDLTHHEIAEVLGKRQGAIRTAHWRLVGKLRQCLAELNKAKENAHGLL